MKRLGGKKGHERIRETEGQGGSAWGEEVERLPAAYRA